MGNMGRPRKNQPEWTADEEAILIERLNRGERVNVIARTTPNRTAPAVRGRIARLRDIVPLRDPTQVGIARSSDELKAALMNAFTAFATKHRISVTDAQTILMGDRTAHSEPGRERIYKTASIQRLAA